MNIRIYTIRQEQGKEGGNSQHREEQADIEENNWYLFLAAQIFF
jgi:hypothetical protein|nr:hypothetical protein [Bacillus infantis]